MRIAGFRIAVVAASALALSGCLGLESSAPNAPSASADVTNAPVGGGVDVPPGSNEDFIVNAGRRIYFNEGSAELTDTAKATLDKQAEWLAKYTRYRVKVEGFADDPGGKDANMALGLRRAKAAHDYLVSKGLPVGRMKFKSFGNAEERLVGKCRDASCLSQNRRVVVVLQTEVGA